MEKRTPEWLKGDKKSMTITKQDYKLLNTEIIDPKTIKSMSKIGNVLVNITSLFDDRKRYDDVILEFMNDKIIGIN